MSRSILVNRLAIALFVVTHALPLAYLAIAPKAKTELVGTLSTHDRQIASSYLNYYPLPPGEELQLILLRLDPQHRELEAKILFDPEHFLSEVTQGEQLTEPALRYVDEWHFDFYAPPGSGERGGAFYHGGVSFTVDSGDDRWLIESPPFRLTPSTSNPALYPFDSYSFKLAGFVGATMKLPSELPYESHYDDWISKLRLTAYDSALRIDAQPVDPGEIVTIPTSLGGRLPAVGVGSFRAVRPLGLRVFTIYLAAASFIGLFILSILSIRGELRTQLAAFFGFVVLLVQLRSIVMRGTDYFPTVIDYGVFVAFGSVVLVLGFSWLWKKQHQQHPPG